MASHRKPRPRILASTAPRAAVGVTAAAIASVTLLSESASAAPAKPKPSITEVKAQIDTLNQQAEVATQNYDQAKEKTETQRDKTNQLLAQVAQKTQQMNESRRVLGQFASEQYRDGGIDQTVQLLLAADPEQFLNQSHMVSQLSATQADALKNFQIQQEQASIQRAQATASLTQLTTAQKQLATQKNTVQTKLAAAQKLLNSLTAEQRAKVATIHKGSTSTTSYTYSGPASGRAAAAISFALAQRGKPYVYGATGPGSYDCSGLTGAAYRAAGVTLGRTTYDQAKQGVAVSKADLRPGDLVFFYSGLSHVGIYLGNGQIVHAPHTGAFVEVAPLSWMPFATARRVA
ncbi:C40 family peptidase [Streptomyces sp. NBC_01477]|uniref:C40 family peptidase n=1 Tax=Streptomyces sp. NBC_01477 TaxID=2976015 RepID=UPI002E2EABB9|nr:NlpC/P60 family protein [Streptomyces sp. NBC_01477]